ncbi:leucine-rich repeat protein soc-2 homolog [Branchiostoma floridae]|uniref:Leucine-rich repeat protein soc-2 homolog n=1 Tax=Branchiostoma floridae TaxID=7739 RepID=A0A9J7HSK3_BRAFL|nr:leucine-rich repeat protein soc-2 homolog [Branchiostoma floridae]
MEGGPMSEEEESRSSNSGEDQPNERSPDDTDREASASGSGGRHSNMDGGAISQEDGTTSLDSAAHIDTVSHSVYPTGEDALAWNDCLQDFFKTDEDTTRVIQQSWPSNLLVKHLIRDSEAKDAFQFVHDSIRQYFMAVWVAHTVRTQTDCTELLRVCAEKSAHLPITCYSLAHLLGMADSPPTYLSQFTFQNIREIDLSHNAISDEAVSDLAEGLGSCQKLKRVDLSHNKLSDKGDFLPPLPNLEEIDLSHNVISDEAVSGIVKGVGSCQNLNHVNLEYNKISNKGALLLLLLLQDQCKQIQVEISGNNISDNLLISNRQNALQDFEGIDLSHNAISDEVVPALAEGLASCQNLKKVNLSYNKLSDRGDFLPPLPDLEEIDLSHNAVSDEAVSGLAKSLGSCQNLKKVNLSHNNLSDRGDFLPPLPNLEEIDLSHNAISDEAVPGLAEGLGSDAAVPSLAKGLGSCQNLKTVDLKYNKLSDVGELIEAFIKLPFLDNIHIANNAILDESLSNIAAWLKVRTDVERVYLYDNSFSAEGVRDFVRTIKGKAYSGYTLLYDGSLADEGKLEESDGEDIRKEEQQWDRLWMETAAWLKVRTTVEDVRLFYNRFSAEGVRDFVRTMKGKVYMDNRPLYDGRQVQNVEEEEQQWENLRSETALTVIRSEEHLTSEIHLE